MPEAPKPPKRSGASKPEPETPTPPRRGITYRLIATFKDLIAAGVLAPGCRLPAERELAARFRVNRASLRQVLKVMEVLGVVSQRARDGTYLNSSAAAILDEPIDFLILLDELSHDDLFEFRLFVEPELAARAAERAVAEDLAALRDAIARLENGRGTKARLAADLAFHEAVCRAAGNRVWHRLFGVINRALLGSMERISPVVELRYPLAHHQAIYEAIYRRDAAEARRRMAQHLLEARAFLAAAPPRTGSVALERIPAVVRP
jgi:GntR family transcriptional regulator, transcriptional repressor for pyruvate dehydrogenase complex